MNMEIFGLKDFTVVTPDSDIWRHMMEQFQNGKIDRDKFEVKLLSISSMEGKVFLLIQWTDFTGKYYIVFQEGIRFPLTIKSLISEDEDLDNNEDEGGTEKNPLSV